MRIDSSNIGMESARSYYASNKSMRRFSITEYRQGASGFTGNALNAAVADGKEGSQALQEQNNEGQTDGTNGQRLYTIDDWIRGLSNSSGRVNIRSSRIDNFMDDFRQATVRYIFELLFANRRNRFRNSGQEDGSAANNAVGGVTDNSTQGANGTVNALSGSQQMQGFFGLSATNMQMLSFNGQNMAYEQEYTSFSTVGTVRTSDGREINFNVDIGMSRQFQQVFQNDLQMSALNLCDPLVINLDTDVAELSDQKFFFDIDADGEMDEISALDGRSGYLALDKNGDGVINDGSELFGTASGDGFADLAKYDDDGNGWIDENDAVWSKLKIWCRGADGKDVLYRLADKGVGAICLQRAATDFTLQGDQGQTKGAIRSTGVFLYENGNVGTMQHVDVAKYEQGA